MRKKSERGREAGRRGERAAASRISRDPPFVCRYYYECCSPLREEPRRRRVIRRRRSIHLRERTKGTRGNLVTGLQQFRYVASSLGAVAAGKLRDDRIASPLTSKHCLDAIASSTTVISIAQRKNNLRNATLLSLLFASAR